MSLRRAAEDEALAEGEAEEREPAPGEPAEGEAAEAEEAEAAEREPAEDKDTEGEAAEGESEAREAAAGEGEAAIARRLPVEMGVSEIAAAIAAISEAEAHQAEINVCFSTTDHALSWIIRRCTRSCVSHAFITFRSRTLGRIMVMQASGHGFQVVPWARWAQRNILIARFALEGDPRQHLLALRAIGLRLGDPYDRRGLLGFLPLLGLRLFDWIASRWRVRRQGGANRSTRPRFHNWLDDPKKLFCSEAVAEFLSYAGFGEFSQPQDWSPANLLELALAESKTVDGRFRQIANSANQPHTRRQQLELPDRCWDLLGIEPPPR